MQDRDNNPQPEHIQGSLQRAVEAAAETSFLKLGARLMAFIGVPIAAFLINSYLSNFNDNMRRTADGVDRVAAKVEADGRVLSSLQTQVQDQGDILRDHGERITKLEERTFRSDR